MVKISVALLLVALHISCGDSETKSSGDAAAALDAPTAPFITTTDFEKPANLETLDAAGLKQSITGNFLEFTKPLTGSYLTEAPTTEGAVIPDGFDSPEVEKCMEEKSNAFRIKAVGSKLSYGASYDVASCFADTKPEAAGKFTQKVTELLTSFYVEVTCDGADFSSADNKTLKESDEILKPCEANGSILSNLRYSTKIEISDGTNVTTYESSGLSADSTADGAACTVSFADGVYSRSNSCQRISKSSNSGEQQGGFYLKISSSDLKWKSSSQSSWYDSGVMDTVVNNWSGKFTYANGSAPSYSMSNGSETVTGSLGTSLTLRQGPSGHQIQTWLARAQKQAQAQWQQKAH